MSSLPYTLRLALLVCTLVLISGLMRAAQIETVEVSGDALTLITGRNLLESPRDVTAASWGKYSVHMPNATSIRETYDASYHKWYQSVAKLPTPRQYRYQIDVTPDGRGSLVVSLYDAAFSKYVHVVLDAANARVGNQGHDGWMWISPPSAEPLGGRRVRFTMEFQTDESDRVNVFHTMTTSPEMKAYEANYPGDPTRGLIVANASLTEIGFSQIVNRLEGRDAFVFGTAAGSTVSDLTQLAKRFNPYSMAGETVIHQEWQRYQPFNSDNFVFTDRSLDLTATVPPGGGLYPGGINSGQLWTKDTYQPWITGKGYYAFEIEMRISKAPGSQSSSWLYMKQIGAPYYPAADGSEIDHPEFFMMDNSDEYDWSGFQHGPGRGDALVDNRTNKFYWRPGIDFSAGYHKYQTLWTPDAVYKYVDGHLIYASQFLWTAQGPAQFGVHYGVGSSASYLPGLRPQSLRDFPSHLSIRAIRVWQK